MSTVSPQAPRSRLGWRLAVGFLVVLALLVLAAATSYGRIGAAANQTARAADQDVKKLLRVQALTLYTESASAGLLNLLTAQRSQREAEYARVDERNRQIDGLVSSLATELMDGDQGRALANLVANQAVYRAAFIDMADQVEAEDRAAALQIFSARVEPALALLRADASELLNRERRLLAERQAGSFDDLRQALQLAGALVALAFVLAGVLAWRTVRSVLQPLTQLESAAQRIALGDYTQPVPQAQDQEMARVGEALNQMASSIASREAEIQRLAFNDPLTGLPNRTGLLHAVNAGQTGVLALVDIARLRAVNETLGYETGDTVIRTVGERLRQAQTLTASDAQTLLARLSGGQFSLWWPGATREQAGPLALRWEQALREPVECGVHRVDLAFRVGLAQSTPDKPEQPATLLRNAEVALHASKRGAGQAVWYASDQEEARLSHLGLLGDLRQAVSTDQLQMWLQPKVTTHTRVPRGFEALVRWQHPQRGFISPAEFIPFAERSGYVGLITDWMLEQAVRTLGAWQQHPPTLTPALTISVNLSTSDLLRADLPERVARLLQLHRVPPSQLHLEVTESGLMDDPDAAITVLHALREQGLSLSIDDFGTGYSSLSYLQRLPVQELKIDRSFVTQIDTRESHQKLVRAVIDLAHGLALSVTAEGVETEAELAVLRDLSSDQVQGYLTGRPMHGPALQAWLQAHLGA